MFTCSNGSHHAVIRPVLRSGRMAFDVLSPRRCRRPSFVIPVFCNPVGPESYRIGAKSLEVRSDDSIVGLPVASFAAWWQLSPPNTCHTRHIWRRNNGVTKFVNRGLTYAAYRHHLQIILTGMPTRLRKSLIMAETFDYRTRRLAMAREDGISRVCRKNAASLIFNIKCGLRSSTEIQCFKPSIFIASLASLQSGTVNV